MDSNNAINPTHYKTETGIEAIDVCEHLGYSLGNCVKYIWRMGDKPFEGDLAKGLEVDKNKALWYYDRWLSRLEEEHPLTNVSWIVFRKSLTGNNDKDKLIKSLVLLAQGICQESPQDIRESISKYGLN